MSEHSKEKNQILPEGDISVIYLLTAVHNKSNSFLPCVIVESRGHSRDNLCGVNSDASGSAALFRKTDNWHLDTEWKGYYDGG